MRFSKILLCVMAAAVPLLTQAKKSKVLRWDLDFPTDAEVSRMFGTLDYGLRVQVVSHVDDENIVDIHELSSKDAAKFPKVNFKSTLKESVEQFVDRLARGLGFDVGTSYDTDYILKITVNDLRFRVKAYNDKHKNYSSSCAMVVSWELLDADRRPVISSTTTTGQASSQTLDTFMFPLAQAYVKALGGIGWEDVARQLKKGRYAKDEANKQVEGSGNTALESTVIRWFVGSRPQGADVSWRVISSTPDVKNTNSNYVGTTPYETTESFDIKGLTYNNSGNVQIEITCERAGYLPQKKRFNVRQAIDQKEISAQFNLVKESDDSTEK